MREPRLEIRQGRETRLRRREPSYTVGTGSGVAVRPRVPGRRGPRLEIGPRRPGRPEPGPYRVAPTTHHERRPGSSRGTDGACPSERGRPMEARRAALSAVRRRRHRGRDLHGRVARPGRAADRAVHRRADARRASPPCSGALQATRAARRPPRWSCWRRTGSYWVALAVALHEAGYRVAVVNPRQAHHFAKAQLRRAKTDALDARDLAQLAARAAPGPLDPAAGGLPRGAAAAGRARRAAGDAHAGAQPAPRPAAVAGGRRGRAPAPRRADRRPRPAGRRAGGRDRRRAQGERLGGVAAPA